MKVIITNINGTVIGFYGICYNVYNHKNPFIRVGLPVSYPADKVCLLEDGNAIYLYEDDYGVTGIVFNEITIVTVEKDLQVLDMEFMTATFGKSKIIGSRHTLLPPELKTKKDY